MEPLIRATNLSAGYGGAIVVRDLDLEVHPGEVVALLGPNGAGKTTTLLTLAGEIRPASGTVTWAGSDAWSPLHRRARQGLAFIPEERSVFPRLSVRQNLSLARGREESRVAGLFPELDALHGRRGGLLSGGEQQMLVVKRALSRPTKLLLADELSLGLAPRTTGGLLRAIRTAADHGVGVLVVEQHVHRVLQIADRVYVLRQGRLGFSTTAEYARANLHEIQEKYLTSAAHSTRAI